MPIECEIRDGSLVWIKNPITGVISYVVDVRGKSFAFTLGGREDTVPDTSHLNPEAIRRATESCPFCPGNEAMTTPDEPLVIVYSHTIEKPYGWIFFYNSKKFVETGIFSYTLAGNGPVIVNKYDGAVHFFGSGRPIEDWIAEYERELIQGQI